MSRRMGHLVRPPSCQVAAIKAGEAKHYKHDKKEMAVPLLCGEEENLGGRISPRIAPGGLLALFFSGPLAKRGGISAEGPLKVK